MKVLNIGSLNMDYVYRVNHIMQPGETQKSMGMQVYCGGKGLNQSVALARAGVPVYHGGMIGQDGSLLENACIENGIDTTFLHKTEGKSGHTIIQVDDRGQNCILLFGGANQSLTREYVDEVLSHFERGDYLLLQNEVNELAYIIDQAYELGMVIVLNPSPYNEILEKCDLSKVSLFLINEVEGYQITGEKIPEKILGVMKDSFGNAKIVLTLGSDGAIYYDGAKPHFQPIFPVKTVDTTAAGDTFTGYFIAGLLEGLTAEEVLRRSAKASSIAVSREGAVNSIPYKEEID